MTEEARFHAVRRAARAKRADRRPPSRVLKTSNGFLKLAFFSDRAFVSLAREDGWPSDRLVRPIQRDRGSAERALRRLGVEAGEAGELADRIVGEWPAVEHTLARMLLRGVPIVLTVGTLTVIGGVTVARTLMRRVYAIGVSHSTRGTSGR